MTPIDKWFQATAGKKIDDDGAYGAQCMDLYADYQRNCLKVTVKGAPAAKDVWNSFNSQVFTKIPNTPSFVPKRGDVAIWYMGTYGHIAICTGVGDTNSFQSLDQNWDPPYDGSKPSRYVTHNYNSFYGVLRPKMDVNFDQDAYDAAQAKLAEEQRVAAETAKKIADAAAKAEAERVAAEQKKLAEEQAQLEKERLEKEAADQLAAEQIKTQQNEAVQVTEPIKSEDVIRKALEQILNLFKGANMNILDRLKSPVVIVELIAILVTLAVFFLPSYADSIKAVALAITSVISVVAGLNNPTDSVNF